jgi:uncharacterized protein (TIGR00730 family)
VPTPIEPAAVAVFCGSSSGSDPAYAETARAVGAAIARRELAVVYGGASVGLMGAVADGALEAGGEVVGVMPQALADRELSHRGLTELHVVGSMHERKALMADLAGAFVALPGGAGTLEEIAEQWTWAQLGVHGKPCGFLDAAGFWRPLLATVARMRDDGFLAADHAAMLLVEERIEDLLDAFDAYEPPAPKWRTPPPPPPV